MSEIQYNVESENDYYISVNIDTKLGIFNPFRLGKWSSFVYNFESGKHYKFEQGNTVNILDTSLDGKYVAYNVMLKEEKRNVFKISSIEYGELLFYTSEMDVLEAYFTRDIKFMLMRAKVHNSISVFIYDIILNEVVYTLPIKTFILDGFFRSNREEYVFFSNEKNVIINMFNLINFTTKQISIEHIDSPIKKIYMHNDGYLFLIDGFSKIYRYEKNNRLVCSIETLSYMPKYQGFLFSMPNDSKFVYYDTPLSYYDAKKNSMESILYYFNVNDGQVKSKSIGAKGGIFKKLTPIDDKMLIDSSGKLYDIKKNEVSDFLLKKYM